MTMQDVRPTGGPQYDVELTHPLAEPAVSLPDLGRFQHLTELERRRVIIRLLCGLVAMEEELDEAAAEPLAPEPPLRRRLPFLGLETSGAAKLRTDQLGRPVALLPYLGNERPF